MKSAKTVLSISLLLLSLFLFGSCSKEIELGQKSGILFLKDVQVGLEDPQNVPWEIGKEREVEISKGFKFDVQVPKLSDSASETLYKRFGVDSVLYRFSKINRGSRRHLGYVTVDSRSAQHITESFTAHIYYHAASVSREFRRFRCPAFEHRKALKDFSVKESRSRNRNDIYARPGGTIRGNVSRLSFSPLIFSGGAKLEGKYVVEVALFNSKDKKLFSNWTPMSDYVEIRQEVEKRVKSCAGVKEELNPLPSSRSPKIEDLQIR